MTDTIIKGSSRGIGSLPGRGKKRRFRFRFKFNKETWKKYILFVLLFCVVGAFYTPLMVFYGPFKDIRRITVGTFLTSRSGNYIKWFLSAEELKAFEDSKLSLYNSSSNIKPTIDVPKDHNKDIEIKDIRTAKFKGKMLFISDPSRVKIALSKNLGETGEKTSEIAKRLNAKAAINAGGFADVQFKGTGGLPQGITVSGGEIVTNDYGNVRGQIIGIDKDGVLVVGKFNIKEIKEMSLKEVVTFGPQLIDNGKALITSGDGGWGVAPRTAIGQRKDGTIIFLVIDGRQLDSIGASLREIQDLMMENGAVTAANLDGGSSATMYYDGKVVNNPSDMFGERYIPTAFVVMP